MNRKRKIYEDLFKDPGIPIIESTGPEYIRRVKAQKGNSTFRGRKINFLGRYQNEEDSITTKAKGWPDEFIFIQKSLPLYQKIPILIHELRHFEKRHTAEAENEADAMLVTLKKCIKLDLFESVLFTHESIIDSYDWNMREIIFKSKIWKKTKKWLKKTLKVIKIYYIMTDCI